MTRRQAHPVPCDRRQFLKIAGSVIALIPIGGSLPGCGGESGGTSEDGPVRMWEVIRYTSSVNSGHSHTYDLAVAAIETPPGEGVAGTTSSSGGHVHAVTVTQAQLASIEAGEDVTVTTSVGAGHTHTYLLRKVG